MRRGGLPAYSFPCLLLAYLLLLVPFLLSFLYTFISFDGGPHGASALRKSCTRGNGEAADVTVSVFKTGSPRTKQMNYRASRKTRKADGGRVGGGRESS